MNKSVLTAVAREEDNKGCGLTSQMKQRKSKDNRKDTLKGLGAGLGKTVNL